MSLDRRLRGCPVLVLDTETTGLSARDQLVEIALVQIDRLFETEPRPLFHTLIDPLLEGPWSASHVHGIWPRDVRGAPTWADVWLRVGPWLSDPDVLLCAHNAPFDRRFMHSERTPIRPAGEWLDTMRICQQIDATPGLAKLEVACDRRFIELDGHRARTDAMATAKLLGKLIPEVYRLPVGRRPPERPSVGQWLEWQRRKTASEKASEPQAPSQQIGMFAANPTTRAS